VLSNKNNLTIFLIILNKNIVVSVVFNTLLDHSCSQALRKTSILRITDAVFRHARKS